VVRRAVGVEGRHHAVGCVVFVCPFVGVPADDEVVVGREEAVDERLARAVVGGDRQPVESQCRRLAVVRAERLDRVRQCPLPVVVAADGVECELGVKRCRGERRDEVAAVDHRVDAF